MSDNEKKRYKIKIDNEEYTIAGPGSLEQVRAAEQLVNEQLHFLKNNNPDLTPLQRANLLAFNAVSDRINKQKELNNVKKQQKE
ncbi:cell division protein ZapA [Paucilactobacillus suebicus]|uniref:Stimulator of FtsZ polymerization and component of cell-division Z-ring n=1 Tax=Paucilactobacillus suebicus DSM 5007 = KCTC 3549 TaxID=1423807 RepID=A0A0R1WCU5_9LACO|nr:cell division protein ZapA [Paucilactobacillus suebicus]KRM13451.1 hypothetical protein FD16_GL000018 [Paucilactobacillus suebicus DSM 5007 = KCTC 3549]